MSGQRKPRVSRFSSKPTGGLRPRRAHHARPPPRNAPKPPQAPPPTAGTPQADGGTRTPDPIITSQPIAPHAGLPVRTPAHESPGPGRKPIGRTQARVRPGCQAEGPRKDPTRWARHAASSDAELTVASDVRFGVYLCPARDAATGALAAHHTRPQEGRTASKACSPRAPRSAAKASPPSTSGDARAFRPQQARDPPALGRSRLDESEREAHDAVCAGSDG